MDNRFKEKKARIMEMANSAGFDNLHQLCVAIGVNEANLYTNLKGKYMMSAKRMFEIANILHCPIIHIIEVFYPEEVAQNRKVVLLDAVDSLSYED